MAHRRGPTTVDSLREYGRGIAGGFLFSLPLILTMEVWAAGVTYLRSRTARMEEAKAAGGGDFYDRVYEALGPRVAKPDLVIYLQGGGACWSDLCQAFESLGTLTLYLGASALAVARHFEHHAKLQAVLYPGLASHPGHALATRQMAGGFGGMMSVLVTGGQREARAGYRTPTNAGYAGASMTSRGTRERFSRSKPASTRRACGSGSTSGSVARAAVRRKPVPPGVGTIDGSGTTRPMSSVRISTKVQSCEVVSATVPARPCSSITSRTSAGVGGVAPAKWTSQTVPPVKSIENRRPACPPLNGVSRMKTSPGTMMSELKT